MCGGMRCGGRAEAFVAAVGGDNVSGEIWLFCERKVSLYCRRGTYFLVNHCTVSGSYELKR